MWRLNPGSLSPYIRVIRIVSSIRFYIFIQFAGQSARETIKCVLFCLFCLLPASAQMKAIDGDTIRSKNETIRLIGFDTPEKHHVRCLREARIAKRATVYLQSLLEDKTKQKDIERIGKDKYKRTLAYLFIDGTDIADIMTEMGFAVVYECPKGRCPKRIDWCKE